MVKNPSANAGDVGLICELGRSLGEGNGKNIVLMVDGDGKESSLYLYLYLYQMFCIKT